MLCAGREAEHDYKGNSYVFGFNYNVQLQREGKKIGERRSICVEKLTYKSDGTIPKLPFWSKTGPDQVEPLNPYVQVEAETIAWAWDVKTETCSEGGMDVTAIENGDSIKVKGADFGAGATSLDVRVASAGSGGNIEVRLDSGTGKLVGTCAVAGTGGAQTWVTKTCAISGASGVHDLFFVFTGGSGSLFNFNWWKFSGSGPGIDGGLGNGGGTGSDGGSAPGGAGGSRTGAGGSGSSGGGSGQSGSGGIASGGAGGSAPGARGGSQTGNGGKAGSGGKGGAQAGGSGAGGAAAGGAKASGGSASGGGSAGSTKGGSTASGCSCKIGRSPGNADGLLGLLPCLGVLAWRPGRHRRRS